MVSLCLFYSVGITFGRCSSELAEFAVHPNSQGRLTPYFNRMHDFSVIIPRCEKDLYVNGFLLAQLDWNSLPAECFLFNYHLHVSKSRIPDF